MIDKKRAIEALKEYQAKCKGAISNTVAWCGGIIQALPDEDEWIPVTERLPEEHEEETDLMSFRHYKEPDLVIVAVVNSDGKRFVSDDIRINGEWNNYKFPMFDVTHWMPLPELPEEGK